MSRRCEKCVWRADTIPGNRGPGCAYIQHTGKSRLKEVYERLGVKHVTDAVREAMKPENCRHFQSGARHPHAEMRILLDGSPTEKNGPPRTSAPTGSQAEKNGPPRPKAPAAKAAAPAKPRKPRTAKWDKEAALELWKQGLLDPQIGERLGVSSSTIERWRHENHLTSNYSRSPRTSELLALWRDGKTDREIAAETGMKLKKVQDWRNGRRLKRNPELRELEQKAAMAWRRALYDAGKTDREIAEALGIQRGTVTVWRWNLRLPANVREKR
jgi:DNA-binding NarL/FixJ family response regulator